MTPTIALATVADVLGSKGMEAWATTTDLATLESIADAIHAFSLEAETETGRWFRQSTAADPWTEVLDVEPGQRVFALRAYPVTSIVSLKSHHEGTFTDVTAIDTRYYTLHEGGRTGQFGWRGYPRATAWPTGAGIGPGYAYGPQTLEVQYVGGLARDVHQIPADLRRACLEQVALSLRRPEHIDVSGVSQSGGSVTFFRNAPLTSAAQAAIERYRRHW